MRGEPIHHPRRVGRHVSGALDLLAEIGARDVRVWKTKHVVIAFNVAGAEHELRMACTPRDEDNALNVFRQDLFRLALQVRG